MTGRRVRRRTSHCRHRAEAVAVVVAEEECVRDRVLRAAAERDQHRVLRAHSRDDQHDHRERSRDDQRALQAHNREDPLVRRERSQADRRVLQERNRVVQRVRREHVRDVRLALRERSRLIVRDVRCRRRVRVGRDILRVGDQDTTAVTAADGIRVAALTAITRIGAQVTAGIATIIRVGGMRAFTSRSGSGTSARLRVTTNVSPSIKAATTRLRTSASHRLSTKRLSTPSTPAAARTTATSHPATANAADRQT